MVRFCHGLSLELMRHGIAVAAVSPGFMRTERILDVLGADSPVLQRSESPEYVGRGIASLAADPQIMNKSGRVFFSGQLANIYNFTDIDGRRVPPYESHWIECPKCKGSAIEKRATPTAHAATDSGKS